MARLYSSLSYFRGREMPTSRSIKVMSPTLAPVSRWPSDFGMGGDLILPSGTMIDQNFIPRLEAMFRHWTLDGGDFDVDPRCDHPSREERATTLRRLDGDRKMIEKLVNWGIDTLNLIARSGDVGGTPDAMALNHRLLQILAGHNLTVVNAIETNAYDPDQYYLTQFCTPDDFKYLNEGRMGVVRRMEGSPLPSPLWPEPEPEVLPAERVPRGTLPEALPAPEPPPEPVLGHECVFSFETQAAAVGYLQYRPYKELKKMFRVGNGRRRKGPDPDKMMLIYIEELDQIFTHSVVVREPFMHVEGGKAMSWTGYGQCRVRQAVEGSITDESQVIKLPNTSIDAQGNARSKTTRGPILISPLGIHGWAQTRVSARDEKRAEFLFNLEDKMNAMRQYILNDRIEWVDRDGGVVRVGRLQQITATMGRLEEDTLVMRSHIKDAVNGFVDEVLAAAARLDDNLFDIINARGNSDEA